MTSVRHQGTEVALSSDHCVVWFEPRDTYWALLRSLQDYTTN